MKLMSFRKYRNKTAAVFAVALSLLLAGCSNLIGNDLKNNGNLVNIRVTGDVASVALPDFKETDFTSYKLLWRNATISNTKQWTSNAETGQTAYQMMNDEEFSIPVGTYTFVLTATDDYGTVYKGTLPDKTVTENTMLSFKLELSRVSSSGNGKLAYNVTYPAESVTKLVVKRYNSTDEDNYTSASYTTDISYTNAADLSGRIRQTGTVSAGAYIYELSFYGGPDKDIPLLKNPWTDYVYITYNKTSTLNVNIDSFDSIYSIKYENTDDASFTGTKPLRFTPHMDITLPSADTVTKTGYTFAGWYTSVDEVGNPTGEPVTGWEAGDMTDDVTLYAKWTTNSYPVKFYTNLPADGNLSETPFATQSVLYNGNASVPETVPERDGYTFVRWTDNADGTAFDCETVAVTGEKVLYAVWSYDVTFDANSDDATGTMEAQTLYTSWLGAEIKALTANAYELDGYSFLGWANAADATDVDYADGENVSFGVAKTLYAVWHDDSAGFVVSFDARGGSDVETQTIAANGTATVPVCTKEDCMLLGWFTSDDGGTTLSSSAYDFETPVTGNIRLYALWVKNTYYVSASGNNSTGNGTRNAPFATVTKAVTMINAEGNADVDFIVVISGEIQEQIALSASVLAAGNAKSLTLRGLTDSNTDIINGLVNNTTGTPLTISTTVPVIMEDITITKGKSSDVIINSGAAFTMKNGSITGNEYNYEPYASSVTGYGGGVRNYGTFIMEDGIISSNKVVVDAYYPNSSASSAAYGGGVHNAGTFIMKGGLISENYLKATAYAKSSSSGYGRSYGSGVSNSGVFTMLGGVIRDNTANKANGTRCSVSIYGNAVYNAGTFNIGGSAYIPAGTEHYVYVYNGKQINITESLTAQNLVAKIVQGNLNTSYAAGALVITASDGVNLAEELPKFAMVNAKYYLDEEGKIASKSCYSMYYYNQNGYSFDGTHEEGYPTIHVIGETTTLRGATKKNYVFGGWFLNNSCTGDPVTELTDENFTGTTYLYLYAKLTSKSYYTITYKESGGGSFNANGNNSSSLVKQHYYPDETEILVNGVKTGYAFDGWYTSTDGGVTLSDEPVTVLSDENCTDNTVLYAKWKPNFTVTYRDSISGSAYTNLDSSYYWFNEGNAPKTVPSPTKSGYVFAGWHTSDDNGVTLSDEPVTQLSAENCTADLTLWAKWKPHYTITYIDSVSGSAYTSLGASYYYFNEGDAAKTLPTPTKTDYIFDGWHTSGNGGITLSEESVTVLNNVNCSADTVLYAKWIPYFTITYKDRNGADFSGTLNSNSRTSYYSGNSNTLTLYDPVKDGTEFLGWYLEADCSGVPITTLKGKSGDITLYALWAVPVIDVQIDTGDISIIKTQENGTVTLTAADGYKDYVWLIGGENAADVITGSSVSEDGRIFTFETDSLLEEYGVYIIRVVAKNNYGTVYSTNITIKK